MGTVPEPGRSRRRPSLVSRWTISLKSALSTLLHLPTAATPRQPHPVTPTPKNTDQHSTTTPPASSLPIPLARPRPPAAMDYTSFTSPPASPLAVAFNPVVVASRGRPAKRYMGSLSARMRHSRGSAEAPIDENLARAVTDRAGRLEERLRVALLGSTEAENNPELRRSLTHLQPADWHVAATLLIKEVTTLGWERAAREEDRVQSERLRRSPFGMRKQPSNASLTNGGVQRATGIEQGMDWELMAAGILLMQDDGIIAHGVISCDEDDDDDDVEYDDDPSGGGGKSLAVALQRAAGRHQHFVGRSVGFSMSPTEFTVGGRGRGREERTKLESRKAAGLTMGIGRVVGGSAAAGAGYLVLKA